MNTPEQDGHIESVHSTLKTEYIWPMEFSGFKETAECIEKAFYDYNNVRLHTALSYMTPNEFYVKWLKELGKEAEPSILCPLSGKVIQKIRVYSTALFGFLINRCRLYENVPTNTALLILCPLISGAM